MLFLAGPTPFASSEQPGIFTWEYYGYTPLGEKAVVRRYDCDHGTLLCFRPGAEMTCHAEVSPGKWRYVRPDQPPLFIGSDVALAEYTAKLVYPAAAISRNVQGKVVVAFVLDALGRLSNYHLVQRIGAGCDEEALRGARPAPLIFGWRNPEPRPGRSLAV